VEVFVVGAAEAGNWTFSMERGAGCRIVLFVSLGDWASSWPDNKQLVKLLKNVTRNKLRVPFERVCLDWVGNMVSTHPL